MELGFSRKSHRSEAETADDVLPIMSHKRYLKQQEQSPHQHSHHHTAEYTLWDQGWGHTGKLPFQANQREAGKPLKENRQQGSLKPENHYNVSRRDLPAVDNPLSIRAFLFLWVWEI